MESSKKENSVRRKEGGGGGALTCERENDTIQLIYTCRVLSHLQVLRSFKLTSFSTHAVFLIALSTVDINSQIKTTRGGLSLDHQVNSGSVPKMRNQLKQNQNFLNFPLWINKVSIYAFPLVCIHWSNILKIIINNHQGNNQPAQVAEPCRSPQHRNLLPPI